MPVRIGAGLSTEPATSARARWRRRRRRARASAGEPCDLAVVFASGTHLRGARGDAGGRARGARARGSSSAARAGGVIGARREVEHGTAVSVWAAPPRRRRRVDVPRHGRGGRGGHRRADRDARPRRRRGRDPARRPATFPTDPVLRFLSEAAPAVPLLGGLASARTAGGATALFLGDEVLDEGAVGVAARRRRDPALRLAGRHADRPGADDHRRRGPRHRASSRASRRSRSCARRSRPSRPPTSRWSRAAC